MMATARCITRPFGLIAVALAENSHGVIAICIKQEMATNAMTHVTGTFNPTTNIGRPTNKNIVVQERKAIINQVEIRSLSSQFFMVVVESICRIGG